MAKQEKTTVSVIAGLLSLVVCVVWSVSDFGVGNLSDQEFRPGRLLNYLLLLLAAGGAATVLLNLTFRRIGLGLSFLIAGVWLFLTQNYYLISGQLQGLTAIPGSASFSLLIFVGFMAVSTTLMVWHRSRPAMPALAIGMIFGMGVVAFQNCWRLGEHVFFTDAGQAALADVPLRFDRWPTDPNSLGQNEHFRGQTSPKPPNIYFIIPDMFMGENEYEAMTGEPYAMDDILRDRGFTVLDNYYSNAPITRMSLAHVFGGEYFADPAVPLTTESVLALPWRTGSKVTKEFRKRGYNIHYYVDTFVNADCDVLADFCFTKQATMHPQDLVFLERTPFFDLLAVFGDQREEVWRRLLKYPYWYEIPEVLSSLPEPGASPHFTFMHFGLPHSPYRYTERCEYYDAYPPIRKDKYRGSVQAYAQHVRCAERQYTQLLDSILARDPDAWIIFQADHGVNYRGQSTGADIRELGDQTVGENLSILGAYKLPDRCLDTIPDDMSPVNTFRIVFSCLDDTQPELLKARYFLMYYLSWQPEGIVREVTDVVQRRVRSFRQQFGEQTSPRS